LHTKNKVVKTFPSCNNNMINCYIQINYWKNNLRISETSIIKIISKTVANLKDNGKIVIKKIE
jgi:hypothetical protein